MGTITINIDDDTEQKFRNCVKETLDTGKGKLGQAVKEALALWIEEKEQKEIAKRQLALLEKGFHFGKYTFRRDELYDRV